jgi:toxin ParE1/3/4
MPHVLKSPRAQIDLAEIWDFIAEDCEGKADSFIDTLDDKFNLLAHNPFIGRARNELAENLRSLSVGRYVIFYLVRAEGIEVVRVLHGARDLDAIFSPDDR